MKRIYIVPEFSFYESLIWGAFALLNSSSPLKNRYWKHQFVVDLQDTDIVIWDVVAESGMYRLRGHKGQVTQARFMHRCNVLISRWDLV